MLSVAVIHSKYTITISFNIVNLLFDPVIIFKGGEAKVDEGQFLLHGNKEGKDLQLGDGSGNQTKMKVRAMFLKIYTIMPYMTAFVVALGVIQAQCSFFRSIPSPSHIHHDQFTFLFLS